MTSFTERLVARGSGRPMGLPLLTLRPAARFEPEAPAGAPDVPVVPAEAEAPHLPAAIGTRKPASSRKPAEKKTPRVSAMPAESEVTVEPEAIVPPVHMASPHMPDAFAPVPPAEPMTRSASSLPPVDRTIAAPESENSREEPVTPRLPERPLLRFDEPPVSPVMRADPAPERQPPVAAPAISIGRIDVQFLPQERPAVPARPEPQRTRGFDTYARARRGLPR